MLTQAQLITLNTDIKADPVLNAFPNDQDGNEKIVKAYEQLAAPSFTVWKSNVEIVKIGDNIVATELAGLSTLNATRLQTVVMLSAGGINPSLPDRRAFFDDIFSGVGGAATRAKLLILWKRLATRLEKLYATGTGSDPTPAILVVEGTISHQEVNSARNLG
jgi:hypothetical protein